jgi:hypothetical protein
VFKLGSPSGKEMGPPICVGSIKLLFVPAAPETADIENEAAAPVAAIDTEAPLSNVGATDAVKVPLVFVTESAVFSTY